MKSTVKAKDKEVVRDELDIRDETSKTALIIGIIMAAIVGIWGMACIIGGIVTSGMGNLIKGYIIAIIGG